MVIVAVAGASLWQRYAAPSLPQPIADVQEEYRQFTAEQSGDYGQSMPSERRASLSRDSQPRAGGIIVHVSGHVLQPGVYELVAGQRVNDAVRAAGGVSEGAELGAINLARPVSDGEHIHVPSLQDAALGTAGGVFSGELDRRGADGVAGCVNINTANEQQLEELDGIGPALAGRIVAYRADRGTLLSVDELDAVTGIGPTLLEKIRSDVCQ